MAENSMKKLGAVLLLAGAIVAGGTAMAGPDKKCMICHFPAHNANNTGDVIVVGENAWMSSHWPHGDCMIDVATANPDGTMVMGHSDDGDSCECLEMTDTDAE
jgi:hypothetical protein